MSGIRRQSGRSTSSPIDPNMDDEEDSDLGEFEELIIGLGNDLELDARPATGRVMTPRNQPIRPSVSNTETVRRTGEN